MRVLIATDGSPDARQAVEWLTHAPLPADAHISVVTALPVPVAYEAVATTWVELRTQASAVAEEARAALAKRWADVTARVVEGEPRRVILDAAAAGADLTVLGARGLGAVTSFLLGSVSLGVAREAPCPVLVCKGVARPIRSITVALDGSDHARAALRLLSRLPLPADVALHLVAVVEPLRYPSTAPSIIGPPLLGAIRDYENESRKRLEAVLAAAAAELPEGTRVTTTVVVGGPALSILTAAEAHRSDLVVVGARGLGAIKRVLLGSVSEAVLRQAACPVLVVHPRD